MGRILTGSYWPKIGGILSIAGATALALGQPWGVILTGIGQAIAFATARQDNVTTEQVMGDYELPGRIHEENL